MISMDQSLINLYKEGQISKETAILYASNPEMIIKKDPLRNMVKNRLKSIGIY